MLIGKQLLISRGALTTFSIANDVAKYFAILPAIFVAAYPGLVGAQRHGPRQPGERDPLGGDLQRARSSSRWSRWRCGASRYRPDLGAARLLRRNLLVYGVGGLIVPFVGIKAIDLVVNALGLA